MRNISDVSLGDIVGYIRQILSAPFLGLSWVFFKIYNVLNPYGFWYLTKEDDVFGLSWADTPWGECICGDEECE